MTELPRCVWCGSRINLANKVGRPAKYCRRSHRQRHYEARRLAAARGVGADEALIPRTTLSEWQDRVYILHAALEDADRDLIDDSSLKGYTEVFQRVYAAASELARFRVEPKAIGSDSSQ